MLVVGHGANSQFGPVLLTALPSGQSMASSVHATAPVFGVSLGISIVFVEDVFVHPARRRSGRRSVIFFMVRNVVI